VRGVTTSSASIANYNFAIIGGGVDFRFETVKFADISFADGGILHVTGDARIMYFVCDVENIARGTGSGVLVNSASAAVVGLNVYRMKVADVSIPNAEAGGLFYLSNSSDIVLSSVQGLCLLFIFISGCTQLRILARMCQ
jgi:hypothetical protein